MRKIRVPSRLNFAPVTILGKTDTGIVTKPTAMWDSLDLAERPHALITEGQVSDPSRESGYLMKKPISMSEQASEKHSETAAQLLVRCLENEGVKYAFGIPGEENIHFIDALNNSSIHFVLVRHEQAASFMADIYGRLTDRAGVCVATLGPGAINLLLGTADANSDSVPVVAISAQGGLNRIYKESHQIIDLVSMFKPVTKWAELIPRPGAVPEIVRKAV